MTDVFESRRFWVRSLCVVALGVTVAAQAPLEFEVASIKRNTTDKVMPGPVSSVASGQYWMSNVTAGTIILRGYPVDRPMDMLNLPDWVSGERYDILAKGEPGATADEQQRMWRALLADRFKLQAHYETRTQQGYHLVFARADRRLGSQLQPSSLDCTQLQPPINRETVAQAKGAAAFAMQRCSLMMVATPSGPSIVSGGSTMADLSRVLSGYVSRPVADRTGLEGNFGVRLTFARQTPLAPGTLPPPTSDAPSLFTAVQEQLGLKLEAATVDVQFLIVDQVERPTED